MLRIQNWCISAVFCLCSVATFAATTPQVLGLRDYHRTRQYLKECEILKSTVLKEKYATNCYFNLHHFNAEVDHFYGSGPKKEWVEMAAFNVFQPGSNQAPFKDYEIVAKIMNQYDIVAANELLPAVGSDLNHNERIQKFILETPKVIEDLERRLQEGFSSSLKERLDRLKEDLKIAPSLYRAPGYLDILDELRKIDPSWSLLLAPSGESSEESNVQEFVGFYYRARMVKPKINEHCQKFKKRRDGPAYACYPQLTKAWLGKSVRQVFNRRPYLASFESGDFDFTLITSHVVFRGPESEADMATVLRPSFGVNHYDEMGIGATKATFARLAEMKIIAEIMEKVRSQSQEKDIIFLGDTNLESSNPQWEKVLDSFPGGRLFIDSPTTVSLPLTLTNGDYTYGMASDYDHVIMDLKETNECDKGSGNLSAKVTNFVTEPLRDLVDRKYLYRYEDTLSVNPAKESVRQELVFKLREKLTKRLTIKRNKIVPDDTDLEENVADFDDRVFLSQVIEDTYYKVYKEIISDHFPIYFACKTNLISKSGLN